MRHAPRIAAFACASLALGSLLAMTVPTELSVVRNSELERLSQPKIVTYPGQDRVLGGPDSYPVTYSPQWLAVTEKTERERMAKWALPDAQPAGYDQPSLQRDDGSGAAGPPFGTGAVAVHRGSSDRAGQAADELASADAPEG